MIATTNYTEGGTQTETYKVLRFSPSLLVGLQQQQSISFTAVNVFLSITAFLGNSLILVALSKETSLHPPSKLLYRCLATADLLVGLVSQPLAVTYWMSLVHEHWSLCRYARDGVQISSYVLCGVSLLTLTAISVDRLLAALLLGTRYIQIITLKRTYIITTTFWILSVAAGSFSILHTWISIWFGIILIPSYSVICTEHGKIQEGSDQCTLGAVSISCLLCTNFIMLIVITNRKTYSSHLVVIGGITNILTYFNSTLNPFFYCWKVTEVRQAVKYTIRRALYLPWT